MRRLVSIAAALNITAAGLTASLTGVTPVAVAAGTVSPAAASRITWGTCAPSLKQAGAQCGFLSVPLDYSKPHGTQIKLAVSRIKHTAAHSQGIIVTNPGGPGVSGLNLNVSLVSALRHEGLGAAAADYDWIGFDPRGVGSSVPAISCMPDHFGADRPSYVPTRKAFTEGSYEVTNARVKPGAGEMLVDAAVQLLKQLKPE